MIRTIFCAILVFVLGLGTGTRAQQVPPDYLAEIQKVRAHKDQQFRGRNSPLPKKERKRFSGLRYYDIDPAYRLEVRLHRLDKTEPFEMITNTGERRKAVRYGYFDFRLRGKSLRLFAYKLKDSPGRLLFVPFTDLTSGTETYGGGRYLDLEERKDGKYVLDFNLAYNPYCAYDSRRYSCPIPPAENHLDVAIRAGEKTWHTAKKGG